MEIETWVSPDEWQRLGNKVQLCYEHVKENPALEPEAQFLYDRLYSAMIQEINNTAGSQRVATTTLVAVALMRRLIAASEDATIRGMYFQDP